MALDPPESQPPPAPPAKLPPGMILDKDGKPYVCLRSSAIQVCTEIHFPLTEIYAY